MGDIKNPNTQIGRVDFDTVNKVWIGGGKNDAVNNVGQEFADITGGSHINDHEIEDILKAVLTSKGWSDAPGLEGVELVSLSSDTFTISIEGGGPSKDFYEFSGTGAADAVAATTLGKSNIDIKNNKSQLAIFDTDTMTKIFIGGGKSNARYLVGQEFADITGGTNINDDEVSDLFGAVVSGSSWTDPSQHGLEGVELRSLTDDGFALSMTAAGPTEDTIIFEGDDALAAIADADRGGVDIKDNNTRLGVYDIETMSSIWIGGGQSDARNIVGEEFAEITGGSRIHEDEVLEIFDALTSGRSWSDPDAHGLGGVELVGLDNDSFSIALDTGGPAIDYILLTNVDQIDGAADYGFFA